VKKVKKLLNSPRLFFYDALAKRLKPSTKHDAKQSLISANIDFSDYEVAVYFFGTKASFYQLEQWFGPFLALQKKHKMLIIARNKEVFNAIQKETDFSVIYAETLDDLMNIYEKNNFKVVLYVNNGVKNFQSLIYAQGLHVHINHGESEKSSMSSNQAKAYDYVLCAGQAGEERYKNKLIKLDTSKFIQIGRPQLDCIEPYECQLNPERPTVLYAPTWEATHESMNYSSVGVYGYELFKILLESNKFNLIYKPHPATGSLSDDVLQAHNNIKKLIEENPTQAIALEKIDINSVFLAVDIAVFDNSSVMIDFLAQDKPMLLTNRFKPHEEATKIATCCKMIDTTNYSDIVSIIENELSKDTYKTQRATIKRHYLGDYAAGESTQKFVDTVADIIQQGDEEIKRLEKNR